jgi:hypothetical protein
LCWVLLTACQNGEEGTASATATTTTTTTAAGTSTDGDETTARPATSTSTATTAPTSGTSGVDDTTSTTGGATSGTTGVSDDPRANCEIQYGELAKQNEHDCTCLVTAGDFPDMQSCVAELGPLPGDCVCPLVAGDPGNAAHLACLAAAELAFTPCVAAIACDDIDGFFACLDAYDAAIADCGLPTKQSLGQVDIACRDVPAFVCDSGESVPTYYACDMESDCSDMSDESEAACMFTCGDGGKIPKGQVCDEHPDCADMSDETDELCKFTCGDGKKIPKDYVCDAEPDCTDASDEAMCLVRPLTRRATGSWSAGTRPTRGRTASPR